MGRNAIIDDVLTEENLIRIKGWAMDGLTNEQIAENLGITAKTLYEWRLKKSELREALKKSREVADRIIENSLFKRATGYDVEEEVSEERLVDGELVVVSKKKTKKHIPPDTTAQIYWLNNRKSDKWKNKQEVVTNFVSENAKLLNDYMGKLKNGKE